MENSRKLKRKTNPIEDTNIVSLLSFGYIFGLLKKAFMKDLEEDDIFEVIKSCKSKELGNGIEHQWTKTASLFKVFVHRFGVQFFIISLINILWVEITSILNPLGISRLIAYFSSNQTSITKNEAYRYAGVVIFLSFGNVIVQSNLDAFQTVVGMKIQSSVKSLLYRKALKLSAGQPGSTSLGNLITLITKDIETIEYNVWLPKEIAIFLIQSLTVCYLMYEKIGYSASIGIGVLFIAVPVQVWFSSKMKTHRLKVQMRADERLQRMQEILSSIGIIKMYNWEQFFFDRVSESRKKEMKNMLNVFFLNNINATIGIIASKSSFCLQILFYVWMGNSTNTELFFYLLNLFNQLYQQFGYNLPSYFSRTVQLYASLVRLNKVLHHNELQKMSDERCENPVVLMDNVSIRLDEKDILKGITTHFQEPGLFIITGPAGCGKSSLLKLMVNNYYPVYEGKIVRHGSVSYAPQEPWLFPSTIRQNILFGEEYNKRRYEKVIKVCALEYDFSLFARGDMTIIADNGINLSKGQQTRINLARAIYKPAQIYLLDDCLKNLDNDVKRFIFNETILKFLNGKVCILVSQQSNHFSKAKELVYLREGKQLEFENISSLPESCAPEDYTEEGTGKFIQEEPEQQFNKGVYTETKQNGIVNLDVYRNYFRFGGGLFTFILIMMFYLAAQFCENSADKLLTKWIDLEQEVIDLNKNSSNSSPENEDLVHDKNNTFMIYGILIVIGCLMGLTKYYALLSFCRNASFKLHKAMVLRLIGAAMSFYDNHFAGNILNRFSYDLHNIDENLPFSFPAVIGCLFSAGGAIVLIVSVNAFFLIPAVIFLVIMLILRRIWMPALRSLKRLEAATRSPLVGLFNSTIEGLTTIQAFNAEESLKNAFDQHQDLYTSALMLVRVTTIGYGFYMELFSALLTISIISRFLFFDTSSSAGDVGLALSQVFNFTISLEWAIRSWMSFETNMTSVERALEYTELRLESRGGRVITNWPLKGSISFNSVNLYYEGCKSAILNNLSFYVEPQEKIGVVGRTGAGKSSVISALYRLHGYQGTIEIDGINIETLSLNFLRNSMSVIPQDPVLFSGTIRQNLDPNNSYTDELMWEVIHKVGISDIVPSLNAVVENKGSSFSSGQKQLLSLARAALSHSKILIMDEANANIDPETNEMLHRVVEKIFCKCTVLIVAHKLNYVLNFDRVMVLNNGNIVEFDNPKVLLSKKDGLFKKMCRGMEIYS